MKHIRYISFIIVAVSLLNIQQTLAQENATDDNTQDPPKTTTTTTTTTTATTTSEPTTNNRIPVTKEVTVARGKCTFAAFSNYRDEVSKLLSLRASMIDMTLVFGVEHSLFLEMKLPKRIYHPHKWIRTTGRKAQSLLLLGEEYDFMSMGTLAVDVMQMQVNVTDNPKGCSRTGYSEEEFLAEIRNAFLNDFKEKKAGDENSGSLSEEEQICNIEIHDDDGTARFLYVCCRRMLSGKTVCETVKEDSWLNILLALVVIIKVLVVLYSPMFVPESLYRTSYPSRNSQGSARLKYVAAQYIYHMPTKNGDSENNASIPRSDHMKVKVVVTHEPEVYADPETLKYKRVRLSDLKNMENFKLMVKSSVWARDKVYEVALKDIRFAVKARRLLPKSKVPVGFFRMIYSNFFRCKIRKLPGLEACCSASMLGKFNKNFYSWFKCMKIFARILLAFVLAVPWFVRIYIYYTYDRHIYEKREEAAESIGLDAPFEGSFIQYLSPFHGLFVIIYLVLVIDSMTFCVLSRQWKEKVKFVLRQCLRDMRERSRLLVLKWFVQLVLYPFTECGLLGFLFFIPYFVILLILAVPIAAFYLLPTLNLTIRLIINLFIFMCPKRVMDKLSSYSDNRISRTINLRDVTENETFVEKNDFTTKGIILQTIVIIMCLISFWSVTLLLMEIISFLVGLFVYTFMGVIINAGVLLRYVSVLILLFLYAKNTFSGVYKVYLAYHQSIQQELLASKKDEIEEVAKKESLDQENTVFRVTGDMSLEQHNPTPTLTVKEGELWWKTSGMLVFLDQNDTLFTPEKFFHETIDMNYHECPGPIYRKMVEAAWDFSRILLFLLFVLVIVMSFGDVYNVSSTNQLLATVVGGFIPLLFRYFFKSSSGASALNTGSIQFRTEFHKRVNRFEQNWPVFDIYPDPTDPEGITDSDKAHPAPQNDPNGNVDIEQTSLLTDVSEPNTSVKEPLAYRSMVMGDDDNEVDIIVDISTTNTRSIAGFMTTGFEKGSTSMLAKGYKTGSTARVYRPERGNVV